MPKVQIESAYTPHPGAEKAEAMHDKYTPPHERKNGPWQDYELDDMGRHVEMADKVKSNPKLMAAMAEHHHKKAKKHSDMAKMMLPALTLSRFSEVFALRSPTT